MNWLTHDYVLMTLYKRCQVSPLGGKPTTRFQNISTGGEIFFQNFYFDATLGVFFCRLEHRHRCELVLDSFLPAWMGLPPAYKRNGWKERRVWGQILSYAGEKSLLDWCPRPSKGLNGQLAANSRFPAQRWAFSIGRSRLGVISRVTIRFDAGWLS